MDREKTERYSLKHGGQMDTRQKGNRELAKIIKARIEEMAAQSKNEHDPYEYVKKVFVPRREGGQCTVSVYSIPPQKCAYPYHYHTKNEEVFLFCRETVCCVYLKGNSL